MGDREGGDGNREDERQDDRDDSENDHDVYLDSLQMLGGVAWVGV
jgi:hypothetical protein